MSTPVDPDGPLPASLLPDSAAVGPDGGLTIGGCDLAALAAEFGTPLFVYDEHHLRARARAAVATFGPDGATYAAKAFLCLAMARLAHDEGLRIDVSTGGELHVALAAGVPGARLVLHGNNKSEAELRRALDAGVGRIVVDSFDEIDRLEALHAAGVGHGGDPTARPKVLVRITPGVEAHTHSYVQTGQIDSKFGFGLASGQADEVLARLASSSAAAAELVGLHAHIGSQIFALESFDRAIELLADLVKREDLPELVLGGGLGVPYVAGERAPTLAGWGEALQASLRRHGLEHVAVSVEPGRSIVAAAAVTLYTVGTVKEIPGVRTYVAVDGGMSDNPRPVLYGSGYEVFLPRDPFAARPRRVRLVGKHCESGDVLVHEAAVPADLAVGDLVATPVTGAYGHSMGSNYNKVPRPAVVFVADGRARLVVRRESLDDLLRLDL